LKKLGGKTKLNGHRVQGRKFGLRTVHGRGSARQEIVKGKGGSAQKIKKMKKTVPYHAEKKTREKKGQTLKGRVPGRVALIKSGGLAGGG